MHACTAHNAQHASISIQHVVHACDSSWTGMHGLYVPGQEVRSPHEEGEARCTLVCVCLELVQAV